MSKSGSPKKRRKKYAARAAIESVAHHLKEAHRASENAQLLLRSLGHLIQRPDVIDREKGKASIPLGALSADVNVEIRVDTKRGLLIFSAPPLVAVEEEAPLTPALVHDILALASKHATVETIATWTPEQQDAAAKWGSEVYAGAAVEEPPFPKMPPAPEHVAVLPNIEGFEFDGKGHSVMRLRHADGREEAIEKDIPK